MYSKLSNMHNERRNEIMGERTQTRTATKEITEELMNELYQFLQGKTVPEKFTLKDLPHLSEEQAFTVIYMLQEWLCILPDTYERCAKCGCIFDTWTGGIYTGDNKSEMEEVNNMGYEFTEKDIAKHYCDGCA